jgi:Glycosyl hydrolases family 15
MAWSRAALGAGVTVLVAAVLVSGGRETDPRAPGALEVGVTGNRRSTLVVDSLGDVVGRGPGRVARADWRWVRRARALGPGAPRWARRMFLQSLLVLRALTDPRSGAVIAGTREGWAYVWPRDAAAAALALAAAGYPAEARRVARFLGRLDLDAAARFYRDGTPVGGREAQGDARGWVREAAEATGLPRTPKPDREAGIRGSDYQEKSGADYLANAIASGAPSAGRWIAERFAGPGGVLVRKAGDPGSGVDSAAAWAVRPFPRPALFAPTRRSLHRLIDERGGRFGIVPSQDWPGEDPWTAPTAWAAWGLAALARTERRAGERAAARGDLRASLQLMEDLRRAATPLGLLPERVDARSGLPRSTTPLAWSHAFAVLALRQLWPGPARS